MTIPPPPLRAVLGEKDTNPRVTERQISTAAQTQPENVIENNENTCPHAHATTTAKKNETATTTTKKETKTAMKKTAMKNTANKLLDVSSVHLEGEETGTVPIYDTCDEVRRKIRALLRKPGVTQAALLRALGKCRPSSSNQNQNKSQSQNQGQGQGQRQGQHQGQNQGQEQERPIPISVSSFKMFMDQQGPSAGGHSGVFYAGYVFFEKLRIRDGKPKTPKRLEMERVWAGKVDPFTGRAGVWFPRSFLCRVGETPVEDQYGMIHFV